MVRRKDFILPDANVKANLYGKTNSTAATRNSVVLNLFSRPRTTNHLKEPYRKFVNLVLDMCTKDQSVLLTEMSTIWM